MKVLIVGSRGMLGTDLMETFSRAHETTGTDLPELDITQLEQCHAKLNELRPDVIINSAAFTQVDACESRQEEAFLANGHGAGNLAKAAASIGALLVFYSTDYVFDGQKQDAYVEEDTPNPQSIYGKSKLMGETLTREHCPNHLILRTSWLFGRNGNNFIRTILNTARNGNPLRVVNDQRGSPTYSKDLAAHTRLMIEAGCRSVYHVTNGGSCTWYALASCALGWAGMENIPISPISTSELSRPARRPANSVLANERLRREGLPLMRSWQSAAREYVEQHLK
ncbi:MAG TPA: dTDP-4-dehydrorhamnose reductase [Acidobacteriota bacterium]|nr:dTDP-4-dehydrorhamnose reductase [Acidobacteriota bacterium]